MMPEYYTNPERFSWFLVETDQGTKRTYAKTENEAREKMEANNLKVVWITKITTEKQLPHLKNRSI